MDQDGNLYASVADLIGSDRLSPQDPGVLVYNPSSGWQAVGGISVPLPEVADIAIGNVMQVSALNS